MENNFYREYINYSGAAKGSDEYWEKIAKEYGVGKQVNYRPSTLKRLTQEQLDEVEQAYSKAVKQMGRRKLSKSSYGGKLVRRDYLQAKAADAIYAISTIIPPKGKDKKGYTNNTNIELVEGGTGYAVQMGINLNKQVYVFDQLKNMWFSWDYHTNSFEKCNTPKLTKKFAGIGTRQLNENGKKAIENIFKSNLNK